ncbi:MAG: asparagine synthase B [Planctomycetes bacterium]|nr:asparagine synthase B [Planctomycetota bacterium]
MCSILAILDLSPGDAETLRPLALERSRRQRHRGPDWSGVWAGERALLVHERLAIVDVEGGAQPIVDVEGKRALAVNGEIYNHRALRTDFEHYAFQTGSDCEPILPLILERGPAALGALNGIYAFVLHDAHTGRSVVARDPIGVIPLYWGSDEHGHTWVASELKALIDVCKNVREFPPGHWWDGSTKEPTSFFAPHWRTFENVVGRTVEPHALRQGLEAAVQRQLMGDVPYGVLLSGGLDSSVVAALAARHAARRVDDDERTEAWWPRLHSFAIGLEGSPDLAAARIAAEALGTVHHGFHYTIDEGMDAVPDVIHHLETYDVTTVRAATPMYLLARRIRAMGIKMVLSGEGSDEMFGGYLYFHMAPHARAFHEETVDKLSKLHLFDCLRANKAMAAWGVEARVPFLDLEFLELAMSIDPTQKMCGNGRIEKHLLREACADLLPESIAWRQKEQFSDGVGYGWIDALKDRAERDVTDLQLARAPERFPIHPPKSKEAYRYRTIFEQHFPGEAAARCVPEGMSIACSTPRAMEWAEVFKNNADPSGRAVLGVHRDARRMV